MRRSAVGILLTLSCFKFKPGPHPRLVSLNPGATSIILALGAEEHLVGVDKFSQRPPKAQVVGDLISPDLEKIKALEPDLVIIFTPTQEHLKPQLEALGIRWLDLSPKGPGGVLDAIITLGETLGLPERARKLADSLRREFEGIEPAPRTKVFLELSENPLYTAGRGTWPDSLLLLAGGENAFSDREGYFTVQEEEVLKRRPQLVLVLHPGQGRDWPFPKAKVNENLVLQPGVHFVDGIKALANAIKKRAQRPAGPAGGKKPFTSQLTF